jgi:hypothetical protein
MSRKGSLFNVYILAELVVLDLSTVSAPALARDARNAHREHIERSLLGVRAAT